MAKEIELRRHTDSEGDVCQSAATGSAVGSVSVSRGPPRCRFEAHATLVADRL